MSDLPRFVIVEDREDDKKEVFNQLAVVGFTGGDCIGEAGTLGEAKELLAQRCEDIGVVFLDLNIPRSAGDPKPSAGVGEHLLDLIHSEFNRRGNVDISVIVVSGEDMATDQAHAELLRKRYVGTLVGVVQKAALPVMLKASVRRLLKDPLRMQIRSCRLDILDSYDRVLDTSRNTGDRLAAAREIAIAIMMNESDYTSGTLGASRRFGDNLKGLLEDVKNRFANPDRPKAAEVQTRGGWGAFLWRGYMLQHLWTMNTLRNEFIHMGSMPFGSIGGPPDTWAVPPEVMSKVCSGVTLGRIAELTVRDLLEWYLPWHEQVFLPWVAAQAPQGGGGRP